MDKIPQRASNGKGKGLTCARTPTRLASARRHHQNQRPFHVFHLLAHKQRLTSAHLNKTHLRTPHVWPLGFRCWGGTGGGDFGGQEDGGSAFRAHTTILVSQFWPQPFGVGRWGGTPDRGQGDRGMACTTELRRLWVRAPHRVDLLIQKRRSLGTQKQKSGRPERKASGRAWESQFCLAASTLLFCMFVLHRAPQRTLSATSHLQANYRRKK